MNRDTGLAIYLILGISTTILIVVAILATAGGLSAQSCRAYSDCPADAAKCLEDECCPCMTDDDCSAHPGTTCHDGICAGSPLKGCSKPTDCPKNSAAKCNTQTGKCGPCAGDDDCTGHTGKTTCKSGVCQALPKKCSKPADCLTAASAKCNTQTGKCEPCADDADCAGHGSKTSCVSGTCKPTKAKSLGAACATAGECGSGTCTSGYCVFADTTLCADGSCARCGAVDPSKPEWATSNLTAGTCSTGPSSGNNPGCFSVAKTAISAGKQCPTAPNSTDYVCSPECPCFICPKNTACSTEKDCAAGGTAGTKWPAGTKCMIGKCVPPTA
jgi:hypothetical protein